MKHQSTFFIIPGFKMQAKDKAFSWLIKFLESKGIRIEKVPITWSHRTLSQNTAEFMEYFNTHKTEENYVLGFSYGAVIALLTANTLKPKKIYLCSLSPDFMEDRAYMKPHLVKLIGKRRFADTKTRSARKLAKELSVPSIVFYGEAEGKKYPHLKTRCKEMVRLAQRSKLVVIKNAPHQIDFPEYMKAIEKNIS